MIDFVASIVRKMGYDVTVDVMSREDKKIGLKLSSRSSSILIGRKGKNLDALQLLANRITSYNVCYTKLLRF